MTPTCVVVGGGVAGTTAALALRTEGFTGRVLVVSEETHAPYTRPALSKGILRGAALEKKIFLRPPAWYEAKRIEFVLGARVTALDTRARRLSVAGRDPIAYDTLLLATGGRARTLPGTEAIPGVFTLRTLDDALAIRDRLGPGRSLLVVGGGFVGAELAANARARGTEVTLLEAESLPLSRLLPPLLGEVYVRLHEQHGVRLLTGTSAREVTHDGERIRVVDSAGDKHQADTLVVAIGLVPNTELAERAGLAVDNGIVVDECCRTSVPGVFAAGDVANHPNPILGCRVRIEHWQNSQHQAAVAAGNMLGGATPFAEVPWVWSDQYDVNLQIAGLPRPTDEAVVRGDLTGENFSVLLLRDGMLEAAVGVNRAEDVRAARKLIAARRRFDASTLSDPDLDLASLAADAMSQVSTS